MKMTKTKVVAFVFVGLCLLAAAHSALAAAASTYVGVKSGDSFEYTVVAEGAVAYPGPGTYDLKFAVTMVADNGGSATIYGTLSMKNATATIPPGSPTISIQESAVNITPSSYPFVINKNISNKTYDVYTDMGGGQFTWVNGTWDANGVLENYSTLSVSTTSWAHTVYTRKPSGIPGYPALLVLALAAVMASLLARKKQLA